ncbi:ModD protein [Pseudobacteroides cellulosolvens]|uniref:Putative pyrophosphorylase ModD n=1 Tax=Pseudobacteroides cellulosolvens ATCC 35603 = DSM 2933 TaxID=398512 RepID=A0A0L6JHH9_9FIRM|nr:ModD protein [Pseudobacteroides cellulosolvens]KNY25178.1 modD protein [Pseudobacteroides cellulosolvens ATCC 35603 = DSM 2933]
MYIKDEMIERFLSEDIPYFDLTTHVLGIGNYMGEISFTAREDMVLSCVEEVTKIFEKLQITVVKALPSGTEIGNGDIFLIGKGLVSNLHMAWKVSLNILEYYCSVATRTKSLVDKTRSVNRDISIVTTRKSIPGTKELAIKAIIAGGALPHRLGLSETILIFKHHLAFLGGYKGLSEMINQIKVKSCEKKIIAEVENEWDAILLAGSGIDSLQFDKLKPDILASIVEKVRKINPKVTLIATGGINEKNILEYASTGVDAISTSSVYYGKPSDIKVLIERLPDLL